MITVMRFSNFVRFLLPIFLCVLLLLPIDHNTVNTQLAVFKSEFDCTWITN